MLRPSNDPLAWPRNEIVVDAPSSSVSGPASMSESKRSETKSPATAAITLLKLSEKVAPLKVRR